MKKLGKWILMSEVEYLAKLRRTSEDNDEMYRAGFNSGKWHSAGGYGKCLKETKAKLKLAQEQIAQYRPIGEIFQPSKELTSLLEDVNGVSDVDAAADFEVVGNQARLAKAKL